MNRLAEFTVGAVVVAAGLAGLLHFTDLGLGRLTSTFGGLLKTLGPGAVATVDRVPAAANGDAPASSPAVVVDSVYGFLRGPGAEAAGYGLYSYALLPHPSPRADAFLAALFARTGWAGDSRVSPAELNLVYLPVHADLEARLGIGAWDHDRPHPDFAARAYDHAEARRLLARICRRPAEGARALCAGDLADGPYLFTYSHPASRLDALPPPYLVLDLGGVHPAAFAHFIAAYKAQVKRTDYTDRERIDAFNLVLLNVALTAADVVSPVVRSVKDLIALVKD